MRRFKILSGISVLVLTYILATASSFTEAKSEVVVHTGSPEEILAEKKKAEIYKKRQQELRDALRAYFNKAIQAGDIVGAGVSIVQGDSILISDGFGKRNVNAKAKVDGETVFRLGSLSKGFASVLAADLKAEGKISWNDKITDYIPEFQFGDRANTDKIKLAHILSHTSGTPYHSFTNLVEAGLSMEAIATRFDEVKPISKPGHQYSYQNAMFSLSQEVMRKATGKDTKTLLQDRFFRPLGMSTVSMSHKDLTETENVAIPHSKRRSGWRTLPLRDRYYNAVAAGGINASSLDMAKWMRFLLGHNPEVMKEEALQEVFNPFIAVNNHRKYYQRWPGHLQSSYGYGWRIHQFQETEASEEYTIWHHGGSVNNYRNEIAVYPESDLGICVLLNGNSKIARTVIPDLHEIVKKTYNQYR
ncbi:beta-lactamase family protein [Maribacter algarum]|uniref:Beta-lactamase family protein n=1 Tax=Maribacter algarum (ex Zhang et al. 2020) TaxID=2578118 RepID=A0A5S3PVX6_9FLAO|nr:serine hydrolase domain-containing protein [Maribacter algarum]TMM57138.1 beta-lactamase family protein [Maribacter algarum]